MSEAKKGLKESLDEFLPLLKFLQVNKNKLDILLSGDQSLKPLMYPVKGKRTTKTVFISDNLQKVMTDYCADRDIKIGDFVELAVIQYLVSNGYEDKITPLLNNTVVLIN